MNNSASVSHNYVFFEGGTGIRIGLALYHVLSSRAYARRGAAENWRFIFETMDAGAEEVKVLMRLLESDEKADFYRSGFFFVYLKLAEKVRDRLARNKSMTLADIAPEWLRNELLVTARQLVLDYEGGYYRDQQLASFIASVAVDCALKTEEDKKAGFSAVVDDVIASNNTYEVRVALAGSGIGGEGVTNLCTHPFVLKDRCIRQVMEDLRMQREQAEEYVGRILKIAVVMTGGAFRFPAVKTLSQDVSGLVAGTLRSYPEKSAQAVNLFYLLEHDACPVQADMASECAQQHKRAHAIELVAAAAIDDFFCRSTEAVSKKQCPVFPHYSFPGNSRTTWSTLRLPQEYRNSLTARLRFDAALFYWLRPQLIVSSEERNNGKLYESEFLMRMYHAKTPRALENHILRNEVDLDREILIPFRALLYKEKQFLKYLREISLTGKNWETGAMPSPAYGTALFPTDRIEHMLNTPDIKDVGGMTGFSFDALSECPPDPLTGKTEDNLYHTRLTMDKLRRKNVYNHGGRPGTFAEVMTGIYEICSSRKETHFGIF